MSFRLPVLEKPKEGAPREGFFEREQYEGVRQHLPADLQLATAIAYTYGWRTQSEPVSWIWRRAPSGWTRAHSSGPSRVETCIAS